MAALLMLRGANAQGPDAVSLLDHGEYVARAAGCMSCHAEDLSGGHEVQTPMGTIVASNISPADRCGTGAYTRDDLEGVLRRGVSLDGRLYPAMPYASFRDGMTDGETDALSAWLQDQDPVERAQDAETDLPFPFNIRMGVIAWNWLFLGNRDLDDVQGAQLQCDAYRVNHLGHCSECHFPRNEFSVLMMIATCKVR